MIELSTIRDLVTIFGVIAGFTYYVLTVRSNQRNQQLKLETRQAQLIANVYNQMDTPEKAKAVNSIFHMKFKDFDELKTKYIDNPEDETWNQALSIIIMLEGQSTLVSENLIKIQQVAKLLGGFIVRFWGLFEPYKQEIRAYLEYPRWASETEYLYQEILKYKETHTNYEI